MKEEKHFNLTKHLQNPIVRWFNGHFITAKQLKEEVLE